MPENGSSPHTHQDLWTKFSELKRSCVGEYETLTCCSGWWGFQACFDYIFNTCHF
jgi:hypothetical protein